MKPIEELQIASKPFVDLSTGEVIDIASCRTPAQQEAYLNWKYGQDKENIHYNKYEEHFYFTSREDGLFDGLRREDTVKLFFLATYIDYSQGLLRDGGNYKMTRKKIEDALAVSHPTFLAFWKRVYGTFITGDDENGYIMKDIFFKGKMKAKGTNYIRAYIDKIRELYWKTPKGRQSYLGYIFCMLRYVNFKHNVLCLDPDAESIENANALTMKKFCNILEIEYKNADRIRKIYRKVTVNCDGKERYFCAFVQRNSDPEDYYIVVNPYVLFSGDLEARDAVMGWYFSLEDKALQDKINEKKAKGKKTKKKLTAKKPVPISSQT